MKNYKKHIDLIIRIIFAGIFIFSSSTKLLTFQFFVDSISDYQLLPAYLVLPAAITICCTELFLGIMILFNIRLKLALRLTIIMLVVFTAFILYGFIYQMNWTCRCFGTLFDGKLNGVAIIRNLFFISLALYVYFNNSNMFSYDLLTSKQARRVHVLFLLVGLFGIYNVNFIKQKVRFLRVGDYVEEIKFQSIQGDDINTFERSEPYLLLIVFSLDDCQSCLMDALSWQNIEDSFNEKVKVVGVGHANRIRLLKIFIKQKRIKFPIYFDTLKEFTKMNRISSPKKILLDKNNKVIRMDPCTSSKKLQLNYFNQLKELE